MFMAPHPSPLPAGEPHKIANLKRGEGTLNASRLLIKLNPKPAVGRNSAFGTANDPVNRGEALRCWLIGAAGWGQRRGVGTVERHRDFGCTKLRCSSA